MNTRPSHSEVLSSQIQFPVAGRTEQLQDGFRIRCRDWRIRSLVHENKEIETELFLEASVRRRCRGC